MARTAFEQIASVKALTNAWRTIKRNSTGQKQHTSGVDKQTVYEFSLRDAAHLNELSRELLSRRFKFQPLKPLFLLRSDGRQRVIGIPCVRDRIVQRALLDHLQEHDTYTRESEHAYAVIRGRSTKDAVEKACALRADRPWVYKTDIQRFFDRVCRSDVEDKIKKRIRRTSLHSILLDALMMEMEQPASKRERNRIQRSGIKVGTGVRQGMPLSPYFANLALDDFDRMIARERVRMVRYVDDLLFFASTDSQCKEIPDICAEALRPLGFQVSDNHEKSKTYGPNEPASFLGVELEVKEGVWRPVLGDKQLAHIRSEIHLLSNLEYLENRNITISSLLRTLQGKAAGYYGTYEFCENYQQLKDVLGSSKRKALKDVYKQLGIEIDALGKRGKRFLEVDLKL